MWPSAPAERDRFIVSSRPARSRHDPWQHQGAFVEDERAADGRIVRVATVLLTGRECPWRCAMCDLWQHTIEDDTPHGAIPSQVEKARRALEPRLDATSHMKLYNAGSFFDPRAVPVADYDAIALTLAGLDRVIVESHPSLVGDRVEQLLASLDRYRPTNGSAAALEVAMGLETAHPGALERLNKRMTLEAFAAAAAKLRALRVGVRVFVLVSPPFVPAQEQDAWLLQSVDVAISCGASAVALVPTRPGNGALERLTEQGLFSPPSLTDVERSFLIALDRAGGRARVFVDVWDIERRATCVRCVAARRDRLHRMNLSQHGLDAVTCGSCGSGAVA